MTEAPRDIQRLRRLLAPKNRDAASRAVRAIREGMRVVTEHPGAGRPIERMDSEFRERRIPCGKSGYLLLCRLDGDPAVELAVRHRREAGHGR